MIGYEHMTQQPSAPAELPYEPQAFQGAAEVFDPSNVDHSAVHRADMSGQPAAAADVGGALAKFGAELPESEEALIGEQPVDVPSEPADIGTAMDKAARALPPTDRAAGLPSRRGNALRYTRNAVLAGAAAVGLALIIPAPKPAKPESPQQQVDQGVSKATLAKIDQERAALGLPPMHLVDRLP
jgi:hypothetical protein